MGASLYWQERLEEAARNAAKMRRWRERRRQQGGCVECKRPARPGRTLCALHAALSLERNRVFHGPRTRALGHDPR